MNGVPYDYWSSATERDWRSHVAQMVDLHRDFARDYDHTFFEALHALNDVYKRLHSERGSEEFDANDERSTEDYFWGLQRTSTVIDSILGSACVVLMRWMDSVKRAAISAFILLETPFPIVPDSETEEKKWKRHHGPLMQNFGTRVTGKQVTGAEAVWQIGNCFKHSNGGNELHKPTKRVTKDLGFDFLVATPQSPAEQQLQDMAFRTVSYTLGTDSIERMAIQLGCGPERGLLPLYEFVESWLKAIDADLASKVAALGRRH